MRVKIDVSPGELYDRLSIAQIKAERIYDQNKITHIKNELTALNKAVSDLQSKLKEQKLYDKISKLATYMNTLKDINLEIWQLEEDIRTYDVEGNFGEDFIETARAIYYTNDRRASIKKEISLMLGSDMAEEKSHME